MARALTNAQRDLLKSPHLAANALATFYLDQGTYHFCDNPTDLFDGSKTYIGASALAEAAEIRSAQDLAAEPVTLNIDGNRMAQYGIADPARVLRDILGYLYSQRRVDLAYGFRYNYSKDINLVIPSYAGKINSARLIDKEIPFSEDEGGGARTTSVLEIVLDSLASRYSRATHRTRSHQDQLEIDPTDMFFSYVTDANLTERSLYWGKDAPFAGGGGGGGGGAGVYGGGGGGGMIERNIREK